MDWTAALWRNSRFGVLTVVIFVSLFALQAGYAESGSDAQLDAVSQKVAPASPYNGVQSIRPFSTVALGVSASTFGLGVEIATPLSRRSNLRADGNLFNLAHTFSEDGISYDANLQLRDVRASYDFFPFYGAFRISGGVAVYNQFNVSSSAAVPVGKSFTLNGLTYYNSYPDPIHGSATASYGNKVAPTVTFGWGNAIPRSGRHLAFPVELGAAFTGTPTFKLAMSGSVCATPNAATCQSTATYPGFASNLDAERKKINDDIAPLRFYPIVSLGVTYRF